MSTKRKNDAHMRSRGRTLALLLIAAGVLALVGNAIFAVHHVTTEQQVINDITGTISDAAAEAGNAVGQAASDVGRQVGETAGDVGRQVGETAGDLGRQVGEAAGELGRALGEQFGGRGRSAGDTVSQWWPLLLVVVGLVILLRRPKASEKIKNDHYDNDPDEEDMHATGGQSWVK